MFFRGMLYLIDIIKNKRKSLFKVGGVLFCANLILALINIGFLKVIEMCANFGLDLDEFFKIDNLFRGSSKTLIIIGIIIVIIIMFFILIVLLFFNIKAALYIYDDKKINVFELLILNFLKYLKYLLFLIVIGIVIYLLNVVFNFISIALINLNGDSYRLMLLGLTTVIMIFTIYISIRLSFIIFVMVDEDKGLFYSIKQSLKITSGKFWKMILFYFMFLIVSIILFLITKLIDYMRVEYLFVLSQTINFAIYLALMQVQVYAYKELINEYDEKHAEKILDETNKITNEIVEDNL